MKRLVPPVVPVFPKRQAAHRMTLEKTYILSILEYREYKFLITPNTLGYIRLLYLFRL